MPYDNFPPFQVCNSHTTALLHNFKSMEVIYLFIYLFNLRKQNHIQKFQPGLFLANILQQFYMEFCLCLI